MFRMLRGWRMGALVAALALMGVAGWLANMPAALVGRVLDQLVEGETATFSNIQPTLVILVACVAGRAVTEWMGRYIVEFIAALIERAEFVALMRHLLRLDLSLLNRERVGALNVRVHRSVSGVVALTKLIFDRFLPMAITAAIAVGFAVPRHPAV